MGDQPQGYTVHLDGLDGLAGTLGQVATDLSSANLAYTSQTLYQSADFGEGGMDQAWAGFDTNWEKELHVTQRALAELVQKVSDTGANYRTAEKEAAGQLTPGPSR